MQPKRDIKLQPKRNIKLLRLVGRILGVPRLVILKTGARGNGMANVTFVVVSWILSAAR